MITPLFPARDPVAAYITLDEALPRGLSITEISDAGSVPELAVINPLDETVLLYDGEELVGAKQNRILNVSVLVGAGAKLPIPVSCVEQGRWNRSSVDFDAATHISHAHLRRRKAEMLAAQPMARGVAQSEVWSEIGEKQERMSVASPTGANARHVRGATATGCASSRTRSRRSRASAAPCSRSVTRCAWTSCRGRRRSPCCGRSSEPGYLLDALERLDQRPADIERIAGFVDEVADAPATRGRRPGSARTCDCAAPA